MNTTKTAKNESRLSIRLPGATKRRIEKAAIVKGLTTTDFAINALVDSADRVLTTFENRMLSDRDRDIFLAMLDGPAAPNKALKAAAARYKKTSK